jgi:hypothetical protein
MKISKRRLRILIEKAIRESGTDPKGFRKDLSGELTDPMINPNDPASIQAAIDSAEEENLKDMHLGQFGAERGDPGRRMISFGPSAQANPNPTADDITTLPVGYPEDPTPRQAQYGQEYMSRYHGMGDEDNMYSVDDTKTQSYLFDDDEDTEESDYTKLGKTDPAFYDDDDDTVEAGITLPFDRTDDFDLSTSEIERDIGSFEEEDTDEESEDNPKGIIARIKSFFSE